MAGNRYTPEQIAAAVEKYHEWEQSPWSPDKPRVEEFARDILGISKPTMYKWVREDRIRREMNGHRTNGGELPSDTITKFVTDMAAAEARIKALQQFTEELDERLRAIENPPAKPAARRRRSPGTKS